MRSSRKGSRKGKERATVDSETPIEKEEEEGGYVTALEVSFDLRAAEPDGIGPAGEEGEEGEGLGEMEDERKAREEDETRRTTLLAHKLWDLVEGEVAYAEDLTTLVQVYLHRLFQLPFFNAQRGGIVARNTRDLLLIHKRFSHSLVNILSEEGVWMAPGATVGSLDRSELNLERTTRRIAQAFLDEVCLFFRPSLFVCLFHKRFTDLLFSLGAQSEHFATYEDYCMGHEDALSAIRQFEHYPEWSDYERRCTEAAHRRIRPDLSSILASFRDPSSSSIPPPGPSDEPSSKLLLRDLLIKPIQKICRYPLLLGGLRIHRTAAVAQHFGGELLDDALVAMKVAAEAVDEATRRKVAMERTRMIKNRIEPHVVRFFSLFFSISIRGKPC